MLKFPMLQPLATSSSCFLFDLILDHAPWLLTPAPWVSYLFLNMQNSKLPPTSGSLCLGHVLLDVTWFLPPFTQALLLREVVHTPWLQENIQYSLLSFVFLKQALPLIACLPLSKQVLGDKSLFYSLQLPQVLQQGLVHGQHPAKC